MDESPDHEPTLIKRGMGVHLNLPDNSSTRNPQFATRSIGVVDASPLCPAEGRRRACKQDDKHPLIASTGPRLGGSTHVYTSRRCTVRRRPQNTCTWHRRGRLKHCRRRLKLTPRTPADSVKKPCRSTHAPARRRGLHLWVR
jgi:hypothetical protein